MKKHIIYKENQLEELLQVMHLCSKKDIGISRGELAYIMHAYFKKWGATELGFTQYAHDNKFIDLTKCTIVDKDDEKIITLDDIVNDLLNKDIISYHQVQAKDKMGTKLWRDNKKTFPQYRKFLKINNWKSSEYLPSDLKSK